MYSTWEELRCDCASCQKCPLGATRTNLVFGVGNENAEVLFIGEGPGEQEDLRGEPFVGRSGQLLDKYLDAIGLDRRKNIYIANMVKCRPPQNRVPLQEEIDACMPYLREQFKLLRPKIVVCLGSVASTALLGAECKVSVVRGTWTQRKGTYFTATYHPAALLRDENKKLVMWQDLKAVKRKLEEIHGISGN